MDFNADSKIEANDVRTIVSHIPLEKMEEKPKNTKFLVMLNLDTVNEEDRSQSLDEINQLVDYLFEGKTHITFEEFQKGTENICSDLFITVI